MLRETDYQLAIDVQDACNLSGVVRSFSEILGRIWEDAREFGESTDYVNQHPISVLFADKIASLATISQSAEPGSYAAAYDACKIGAEEAQVSPVRGTAAPEAHS